MFCCVAANFTLSDIFNADNWIEKTFKTIEKHNFDGINIFVDDPVEANSAASKNVTNFIRLVTDKFRQHFPGSLVLFNVPFSPYNEKSMAAKKLFSQFKKVCFYSRNGCRW